jgi:hypothetical protein
MTDQVAEVAAANLWHNLTLYREVAARHGCLPVGEVGGSSGLWSCWSESTVGRNSSRPSI